MGLMVLTEAHIQIASASYYSQLHPIVPSQPLLCPSLLWCLHTPPVLGMTPSTLTIVFFFFYKNVSSAPSGCVAELQKWDGGKWLTVNWHNDLKSCTLYELEPAGRTLECTECAHTQLNDGTCDAECNIEACSFDGDDCIACPNNGEKDGAFVAASDEANIWEAEESGSTILGVGTTATWGCNEGLGFAEGTPSTSTCSAGGEWNPSIPECIATFCSDPNPKSDEPSGVLKLGRNSKGTGNPTGIVLTRGP